MAEVDVSSYPTDPNIGTNKLISAMELQRSGLANKLLQQQYESNQGAAGLYSNAPLDSNGNPDRNYINRNIGQAGIHAGEVLNNVQQLGIHGQELNQKQLETRIKQNSYLTQQLTPYLNDPEFNSNPQYAAEKVAGIVGSSAGVGNIDANEARDFMANIVTHPNGPAAGARAALATSQMQLGQDTAAAATMYNRNLGISGSTPVFDKDSGGMVANASQTPVALPTSTGNVSGEDTSKSNINPATGGKGIAKTENKFSNQPQGSKQDLTPLSAPLNYEPELNAARDEANSFISQGNNAIKLEPSLKGVLQLADAGGPNQPGFNAALGKLKDTPIGDLFNADVSNQVKMEKLEKFASDVSGQNMSANARNQIESSVQALSNPNAAQFPDALRTISKFLLGRVGEAKAHADYLTPIVSNPSAKPADILNAQKDWRDNYDQSVYEMPYMNEDEKRNLIGSMSPKEYNQFKQKKDFAIKNKLADPSDFQ